MSDFLFYLKLGWEHIISWDALDHQLFVLVLIVAYTFNDFKKLLILITAFTVGHSITLALSVLDLYRLPSDWVEFLIPLTIVITALNNIVLKGKIKNLMQVNYFLALGFGLIHGLGFANIARMSMAKEQNIAVPLLGFNVGLELGQIVVVLALMILAYLVVTLFRVPRKDWIMFISSGVFALALKMALERIPG